MCIYVFVGGVCICASTCHVCVCVFKPLAESQFGLLLSQLISLELSKTSPVSSELFQVLGYLTWKAKGVGGEGPPHYLTGSFLTPPSWIMEPQGVLEERRQLRLWLHGLYGAFCIFIECPLCARHVYSKP